MASSEPGVPRVVVDGKFFRLGTSKFFVKGVTYGPFAPNADGETFSSPAQAEQDFRQIRELGANLLRVYYVPPRWLLDLATRHELKLLVDIPWPKHLCFLDSEPRQREACETVRRAVTACRDHPAVFAYSVVNEIPADIVRWSGSAKVEGFIEELVNEAKSADPACLCTFTNFPPTEFLRPQNIDFVSFNVYLHERKSLEGYLARLQMLADTKPLMLAELGMDSQREGEARKCDFLSWQIEAAFRGGLAGAVVFSFTDDWFRGGLQIEDWAFGLTTRDRQPKYSFTAVQRVFRAAPHFPPPRQPRVSVVVASFNGARTLPACLNSLVQLNYPDYEIILVDDGSTDNSLEIAKHFPDVRTIAHPTNQGLSVARNTGIAAARGEIIAFTDSDCRADEDWLFYLVGDLLKGEFAGIGGHNFLPPDDSLVAAAVMVSPGGPAHVMLSDREAEHIPGCNMAFYKWVLEEIGGFDPIFHAAGDDVDVCWRVQQHGHKIGFSPAGFVWHYRRSTVPAYLRQQQGYGEAEALLLRKHPEYFNSVGRSIWRGRIYATAKTGVTLERSVIYHGLFGGGFFQKLYTSAPSSALMFCTSLEYHLLITGPLFILSAAFPFFLTLAFTSLLLSLGVCGLAAAQASLPRPKRRFWSRPLVALLFFLQPIERGFARYRVSLTARSQTRPRDRRPAAKSPAGREPAAVLSYWTKDGTDRFAFLRAILGKLDQEAWQVRADSGWMSYDLEIIGPRWSRLRLTTMTEELEQGKRTFRCRLQPQWSLLAKVFFWTVLGAELFLVGLLAPIQPWIWMLLLTVPMISVFLEYEQWTLLQTIAALLDETASGLRLVKLEGGK